MTAPQVVNVGARPLPAMVAALSLNAMLGSLYAWSIFVLPVERELGVMRAQSSAVFATAFIFFAIGGVVAPYTYRRVRPALLIAGAAASCAAGLLLAASASGLTALVLGYGLLFGFGSGFAYCTTLQLVNVALPHRRGLATGAGIAAFAIGSILATVVLAPAIDMMGVRGTFMALATTFVAVGLAASVLTAISGIVLPGLARWVGKADGTGPGVFPFLWAGFFLAAAAGVMAIGHAAAIVSHYGGAAALAVLGTVLINIGNAGGRLGAGWVTDHRPPGHVAAAAHACGLTAFALLLLWPGAPAAVVALALLGLSYGAASAVYPACLSLYFGAESFGRYFGPLLSAWGVAGLTAPWLAGVIFDRTGGYTLAFLIGGACALAGIVVALRIPPLKR